jgi:hypothetical protein
MWINSNAKDNFEIVYDKHLLLNTLMRNKYEDIPIPNLNMVTFSTTFKLSTIKLDNIIKECDFSIEPFKCGFIKNINCDKYSILIILNAKFDVFEIQLEIYDKESNRKINDVKYIDFEHLVLTFQKDKNILKRCNRVRIIDNGGWN